ncbi:DUF1059 domain-containing protein [Actinotalea sp. BY-33]|uniref:DUF1059 domain-containing protein n=1 Tax=Actinotalea soli TaxID=2819234 RepID=A0A939LNH0_9CELL|nr:DUF1059 domain-containing protein [Actinotalea soli]MBO1750704.1 DUF1059 domain-containing protein [Actinotalea soli]
MKTFRCGDVVPGCTATFHGADDEILGAVGRHATADHGITTITPELVSAVREHMVPAA